jgi:hypothetical protein
VLSGHIVRYSFPQAYFDTPTVGHFVVFADSAAAAVQSVRDSFKAHFVTVEYVAPGRPGLAW